MTASRVALFPYALLIRVLASGCAKRVNVATPPDQSSSGSVGGLRSL